MSRRKEKKDDDIVKFNLFDQFIRQTLIDTYVEPGDSVCEVLCGKSADLGKLQRAKVQDYTGIDPMPASIEEAKKRWQARGESFPAEFVALDLMKHSVKDRVTREFDSIICFGKLQHSFADPVRAVNLIHNIGPILKLGGWFFGFTFDSSTLWSLAQKTMKPGVATEPLVVENELFDLEFAPLVDKRNNTFLPLFQPYGSKFSLTLKNPLQEKSDPSQLAKHNHYCIHFPSLLKVTEKVGLELMFISNFRDFYNERRHACKQLWESMHLLNDKGKLSSRLLELLSLYCVFAFKKIRVDSTESKKTEREKQQQRMKRPRPSVTDETPFEEAEAAARSTEGNMREQIEN